MKKRLREEVSFLIFKGSINEEVEERLEAVGLLATCPVISKRGQTISSPCIHAGAGHFECYDS